MTEREEIGKQKGREKKGEVGTVGNQPVLSSPR